MLPKHVRYQTALHPGASLLRHFPQATYVIIHDVPDFVKGFFEKNQKSFYVNSQSNVRREIEKDVKELLINSAASS